MPADDLVLTVRQIAGYPPTRNALPTAALLMQLAGLGGPYASISPADLVGTALAFPGGSMAVGGNIAALSVEGGTAQFNNGAFGLLEAQKACLVNLEATYGSIGGVPIATEDDIAAALAGTVSSFNARTGAVILSNADILAAGGAPIASPAFTGAPSAPTAALGTSSGQLATTAFVMTAVADSTTGVVSWNGRSGLVVLTAADVTALGFALLASPTFTGSPAAPTAGAGTNTTQLATCAFVQAAIVASTTGVASFNGRTGDVTLIANDISGASGALLASPAFTGIPTAPTAAASVATNQLATCAFVQAAIAAAAGGPFLPLAGGTLTGPLYGTAFISSGNLVLTTASNPTIQYNPNLAGPRAQILFDNLSTNEFIGIHSASGGQWYLDGNGFFGITGGTALKPGGGTWTAPSDARIKTVEGDWTLGLDEVVQLRPVVYRYKGNDAKAKGSPSPEAKQAAERTPFVGLVGQEVEPIFPGMVTKRAAFIDGVAVNDLRDLDTSSLIFALVNAVKTLAARLAALET
jgi:hypothetical protein